jgi:hypothetical protein
MIIEAGRFMNARYHQEIAWLPRSILETRASPAAGLLKESPAVPKLCQNPSCLGLWRFARAKSSLPKLLFFREVVRTRRAFTAGFCTPKAGALPRCGTPRKTYPRALSRFELNPRSGAAIHVILPCRFRAVPTSSHRKAENTCHLLPSKLL